MTGIHCAGEFSAADSETPSKPEEEMLCEMFWSAKEVDHAAWDGSPFVIPEALVLGSTQGRTPEEKVRFRLEMYCSEEADGRRGVSDFESASV